MSNISINEVSMNISGLEAKQKEMLTKRKQIIEGLRNLDSQARSLGLYWKASENKYRKFEKPQNLNNIEDQSTTQKKLKVDDDVGLARQDSGQRKESESEDTKSSQKENDTKKSQRRLGSAVVLARKDSEQSADSESSGKEKQRTGLNAPEDVKRRNRNLFGSLMGHLKKAKNVLENEQQLFDKQSDVAHKVEEKNEETSNKLKEKQSQKIEKEKSDVLSSKVEIERSLLKNEHQLLYSKIEKHYLMISSFLQTKEQPPLFWQPNKMKESLNNQLKENKSKILNEKDIIVKNAEKNLQVIMEDFENSLHKYAYPETAEHDEHEDQNHHEENNGGKDNENEAEAEDEDKEGDKDKAPKQPYDDLSGEDI